MILTILILAITAGAQASSKNLADAVVCYSDSTQTSIQSVRYYPNLKYEQMTGQSLDFGSDALTLDQKKDLLINRLSKFDPEYSNTLDLLDTNFINKINQYLKNESSYPGLKEAIDRPYFLTSNCYFKQLALQGTLSTGKKTYVINEKYFNNALFNKNDKLSLINLLSLVHVSEKLNPSYDINKIAHFNAQISTGEFSQLTTASVDRYFALLTANDMNFNQCKPNSYGQYTFVKNLPNGYNVETQCLNQNLQLSPSSFIYTGQGTLYTLMNQLWIPGQTSRTNLSFHKFVNSQWLSTSINWHRENNDEPYLYELYAPPSATVSSIFNLNFSSLNLPCTSSGRGEIINIEKATGKTVSCSLDSDVSFSGTNVKLSVGKLAVKNNKSVLNVSMKQLNSGVNSFKVYGSSNNLTVSDIYFSSDSSFPGYNFSLDGKMVSGSPLKGTILINGKNVLFKSFDVDNNKLNFLGYNEAEKTINNKAILAYNFNPDLYCQNLGYERMWQGYKSKPLGLKLSKMYVIQPTDFYDAGTQQFTTKTDEEVEFVDQIICEKNYSLSNY
jgi:hypothetical protein